MEIPYQGKRTTKNPIYSLHANIIQRTENPNVPHYRHYGGKGIKIWDGWRNDFDAFEKFCIENGWYKGSECDRFPKRDGNYEPGNIRFTTKLQNILERDFVKLNEEKIAQMRILRSEGLFYREIAQRMDLTISIVANFFRKKNGTWKEHDRTIEGVTSVIRKESFHLSPEQVRQVLLRNHTERIGARKLARIFHVSAPTMTAILNGKSYNKIFREFQYVKMAMFPHPRADYAPQLQAA